MATEESIPGVRIFKLAQKNPKDTRGETWEWPQQKAVQLAVGRRKPGRISCHYHTGADPSKNPERLLIVLGRIKFIFSDRNASAAHRKKYELIVEAGTALEIDPNIIHYGEALDYAIILESRPTLFNSNEPDTYPIDPETL